jgi:hypothetical protein
MSDIFETRRYKNCHSVGTLVKEYSLNAVGKNGEFQW